MKASAAAAIAALALSACSSIPTTHVVLSAPATVPQMTQLSHEPGAIASVITVSGDEEMLSLESGGPDTLVGRRMESDSKGEEVSVPFDSLALIYYTHPASDKVPDRFKLPEKYFYPKPKPAGAIEKSLSCEAIDVELARAEALRWFARDRGALPYTSGEKIAVHAKNTAIGVGIVLLVLASGGNVPDIPSSEPEIQRGAWAVNNENFRWAVSAIDERIGGLLQIKDQKSCAGTPQPPGRYDRPATLAQTAE